MKRPLILFAMILSLMIFGCTQPDTTEPTGTTTDTTEDTSTDTTGDATDDTSADTTEDTTDLSGMEYAALMALGIPLECDITVTSDGQTITQKMYTDGKGNMRSEVPVEDAQGAGCSRFIVIFKDEKMYMGCEGGKYPPGTSCDWMLFEQSENATSSEVEVDYGTGGGFETDYSEVPAADIDCNPWILDPSKFTATGKICDMEDLMGGYEFG